MVVKFDDVELSGRLNASLNMIKDVIDSTSADNAGVKSNVAGEYGATFDFNALYDPAGTMSFYQILTKLQATDAVEIYFGDVTNGEAYFYANAHINAATLSADKNDVGKVSGSLTITGDIDEGVATTT